MAGTTKCSHTLYWQDLLNHISILSTITQAPSTTIHHLGCCVLRRSL